VLEAVAYSPVRSTVTPAGYPATVTDELKSLVTALAGQVPDIAKHFGIEAPPPGARPPRQPRRPAGPRQSKATNRPPTRARDGGGAETPTTSEAQEPAAPDAPASHVPASEAPLADAGADTTTTAVEPERAAAEPTADTASTEADPAAQGAVEQPDDGGARSEP
jgi:hypothetical protein